MNSDSKIFECLGINRINNNKSLKKCKIVKQYIKTVLLKAQFEI